jgi:hypothetical protein
MESRRTSEEPWQANGPSGRGKKRASSPGCMDDGERGKKPASSPACMDEGPAAKAPYSGWGSTSELVMSGPARTQQEMLCCPPAAGQMRPGPDSEFDPKVRLFQWAVTLAESISVRLVGSWSDILAVAILCMRELPSYAAIGTHGRLQICC